MSDEILTSLQNPRVKQLVKLREPRERRKTGLTRIDGARELLRAMQADVEPSVVYVCEPLLRAGEATEAVSRARARGVTIQPVNEAVYEKIRYGDRDEGLCAVLSWRPAELETLTPGARAFVLVIEAVEKPGNLGAILRTADAAGVDAVILADPACEPANPNVIRASMGTLFTQPVAAASAGDVIAWLGEHSVRAIVTRPQAPDLYTGVDLTGPVAVVLGAEHAGLSAAWDAADATPVRIPMAGVSDSLNLAAATAVLAFEVVRQRSGRSTA